MMKLKPEGILKERFDGLYHQWISCAPYTNPGMLEMYFRRNAEHQDIMPWYGEFSGKYLTSAALCYRLNPTAELKETLDYVVDTLEKAMDADGYLGVWPDGGKIAWRKENGDKTWDAWGHYHNMLGLYFWNRISGNEKAGRLLHRTAAFLHRFFVTEGHPVDEDKDGTDAAVGHIFALLYEDEKDPRWMEVIQACLRGMESPAGGGDYLRDGLNKVPFWQMKCTRWESLHAIEMFAVLYRVTKEEKYKEAFVNIWDSIVRYDRHNTGGFSSGESAKGDPYDPRAIETCCTVAWYALTEDMLGLSEEDPALPSAARVADELELIFWNGYLGAMHPSGRYFTYNTPMAGEKKASAHDIVFQAAAGSPELNCCSVNGPRGFGMLPDWGFRVKGNEVAVNFYTACTASVETNEGIVKLKMIGGYPFTDRIRIEVGAEEEKTFTLKLRIPGWSEKTVLLRDGKAAETVLHGTYFTAERVTDGTVFEIVFDMRPHFWYGKRSEYGNFSLYRGPVLLAFDEAENDTDTGHVPAADIRSLTLYEKTGGTGRRPEPLLRLSLADAEGEKYVVTDFSSAGQRGSFYTTWFPMKETLTADGTEEQFPQWEERP